MPKDEFDHEDPFELVGTVIPDPDGTNLEEMARCIVEEYVRVGFSDQQLWGLFHNPFFGATHALYRARGETWVQEVIDRVREKWGQPQFTLMHGDGDQEFKGRR